MEAAATVSRIPTFLSLRSLPSKTRLHRPISPAPSRNLTMAVRSQSQETHSFFRPALSNMERIYLDRNPTAKSVLELVRSSDGGSSLCYDHFAFRTFGADGHGIESIARFFLDFGYEQREELRFPVKKLRALWFAPPPSDDCSTPLPRIFVSELLVDEMSAQSQEIIRKYTKTSGNGKVYAALASSLGCLTWETPIYSDYQQLSRGFWMHIHIPVMTWEMDVHTRTRDLLFAFVQASEPLYYPRESEYAAWTLVNGYAVNHVTISAHRLKSHIRNIKSLNQYIEDQGFKLNSEGGTLKVSPDGLLLQSSTVADSTTFNFADGVTESVPCSYIEFAERLILPQYKDLKDEEIKEFHRRDGFEVGNADKIFESTSKDQLTRKAA